MTEEKDFERAIGAYIVKWEEASEDNGKMPWLVIKAMSGQWETRLRGDMNVVLMWRRLLESEGMEDYLHGQLRMMQMVNQTINDPITEVILTSAVLGSTYLLGKDGKIVEEYNFKRMEIAQELTKLVNGLIPKRTEENTVSDEEKAILNNMRAERVSNDLNKGKEETR